MSYLIDDMARALAKPMPRRQALKSLGGVLGGAALAALFPKTLSAAACGTTKGPKVAGLRNGRCQNGVPNAQLAAAATAGSTFNCPNDCPTKTVAPLTCTGGNPGNGNCTPGNPCTVTAASITCACTSSSCGNNRCCCTTNGTCAASSGTGGNCVSGFPLC